MSNDDVEKEKERTRNNNLITIGVDGYEYDAGFPVVYYFKGHQFFNRVAKELKSLAISLS